MLFLGFVLMERVAVFVDAGYVFAAGSAAIVGQKAARETISLDAPVAIERLRALASSKAPDCKLLRIYWYDGSRFGAGQSTDQATLAHLDDVKLRLGFVNSHGQQKGVDSLIVTDLIELARLKAISEAVLISGDEDVRVGVQIAQNYGVRVHLIGIHPSRGSQSLQLQQEADTTTELSADDIRAFLSVRSASVATPPDPALGDGEKIETAAAAFAAQLTGPEIKGAKAYWRTQRGVPPDLDRKLLPNCGVAVGRLLEKDEKSVARAAFQKAVQARLAAESSEEKSD